MINSWRRCSITILCRILVCFFFSSKWAECALRFNRKLQPWIFFRWFALRFPVKTYAKKLGGAFCSLLLNDQQKKPFVFPNNEISEASRSRLFFAYVFTQKWSANQGQKMQGCDFLLNRRVHAKIQLIWTKKKKNRPKFDIEWLCCDVFNYWT